MYCVYDEHKDKCGPIPLEDMVISQFSGMLLTSFFWCNVYIVYMQGYKNTEPFINKLLVGPGFVCGAIWAVAQISWFYANANLPLAVSFPIIQQPPVSLALSSASSSTTRCRSKPATWPCS